MLVPNMMHQLVLAIAKIDQYITLQLVEQSSVMYEKTNLSTENRFIPRIEVGVAQLFSIVFHELVQADKFPAYK